MRKWTKGLLSAVLACVMAVALFGCEAKPVKVVNTTEPEKVTYGKYAQQVVTDKDLISALDSASGWSNDRITLRNTEYERVVATPYRSGLTFADGTKIESGKTYYFSVTPIEWYLLSSEAYESRLLSVNILDVHVFATNTEYGGVSLDSGLTVYNGYYPNDWGYSDLRSWLNGDFQGKAFTALEYAALNTTKVVSAYPQAYYSNHSKAIADTYDKVYCMSYAEMCESPLYSSEEKSNKNGNVLYYNGLRMAEPTDYARAKGAWYYVSNASESSANYQTESLLNGNGIYWLRTVGQDATYAATVRYTGEFGRVYEYVNKGDVGVRPAVSVSYQL